MYNPLMYSKTRKEIYSLRLAKLSHKNIADKLNISEGYVNQVICSEKFKLYLEYMQEGQELRDKDAPRNRTRRLVDELLQSLEQEMERCSTPRQKLSLVDSVKQLVGIVGIESDESQGINVVEVPEFASKDDFNRMTSQAREAKKKPDVSTGTGLFSIPDSLADGITRDPNNNACTGDLRTTAHNTLNPMGLREEPKGYETPTPTHTSENPWAGLDA